MDERAYQQEPFGEEELPPNHRSGFVAMVGKPNVGKSTLLNAWLGVKLAPVSPKPQTTRTPILGILTRADVQVIFVDTPGIHKPRTLLGEYMLDKAQRAIDDADLILFIVDVSRPPDDEDRQAAQFLAQEAPATMPILLALNKADAVSEGEREAHRAAYEALGAFQESMYVSALTGLNREELLQRIIALLPKGPRFFPADQLTDAQERFVAAELIREQVLHFLEQEVPHAVAVVVQEFKERPNDVLYIAANIFVEKDSQKGIVIGHGGSMLKRIGQAARQSLEEFFGTRVYLDLWVKVRKNWRRNERYLRQLGYPPPRKRTAR
ncbi:MAG: GTPase Era [Chloroflexi bacterium]|nr:GTPase Era [Chloroflexota bacterium]